MFIFKQVKLHLNNGKVNINCPVYRGMIKIGISKEIVTTSAEPTELHISGVLNVNGSFTSGLGCKFIIEENAVLDIGENSRFGRNCKILVTKKVYLANHIRMAFESQIMDSNFHYILDIEKECVQNIERNIEINDYCWIGNRTTIMKGTKTPKQIIIASNSLLNKDYTLTIPPCSIMGEIPAKLIKTGYVRLHGEKEWEVDSFFKKMNSDVYYFK